STMYRVPAAAPRRLRVCEPLGGSLRRLVQRHALPQRDPLRDAGSASSWARRRRPRESPRTVPTRAQCEPGALERLDPQLVARRACRAEPRTCTASGCCVIDATTTLTLTRHALPMSLAAQSCER